MVSPLSDPKKSPFWSVISEGCSSDPSLILSAKPKDEEEEEGHGNREVADGNHGGLAEDETQPLRFSFILRPVFNDSMQFLHCSLRLCASDSARKETEKRDCRGRLRVPPLASKSTGQQVRKTPNTEHRVKQCYHVLQRPVTQTSALRLISQRINQSCDTLLLLSLVTLQRGLEREAQQDYRREKTHS